MKVSVVNLRDCIKYLAIVLVLLAVVVIAVFVLSGGHEVVLKSEKDYILNVNDIAVVKLEENPSTGHTWSYKIENGKVLAPISDSYIPSKDKNKQGAGIHEWKFKAVSEGETDLVFEYNVDREGQKERVKKIEYKIEVRK